MSTTASPPPPRILVVGCGGIGGVVAGHLFEQGHDITALTTNAIIADAINADGFRLRGDGSPGVVRGRAVTAIPKSAAPFDYILLATQPPQVEDAARGVLAHLAPGGAMVCFQNGLCEERIAAITGPDRTLGAIVAWGATMVSPGVYDRTSAGGFVLGRLDGTSDARIDELARILEAVGPTTTSSNLAGARWSKLAINCAISSLGTLGGDRLGVLMRHRHVRRLALEIMTETVAVARALDIRLEKVAGTLDLDWIALTDGERVSVGSPGLFAKHALLLAVGARYRRLRSSMLTAIERGRPPAVDFLNGEVVSRGAVLGIPTPINSAIRAQVFEIAQGKAEPGIDLTRRFFERTRTLAGTAADASYGGDASPPSMTPAPTYQEPPAAYLDPLPPYIDAPPPYIDAQAEQVEQVKIPPPPAQWHIEAESTFEPTLTTGSTVTPVALPPPDDSEPRN